MWQLYTTIKMNYDSQPPQLYLLVPWELPIDEELSSSEQVQIRQILHNLLQALNELPNNKALDIVNRELANLDLSSLSLASIVSTETSLKPWEVKDFNQYFNLTHVTSENKSICLVLSLLTVYKTLLLLEKDSPEYDSSRLNELYAGFRSYVYLIGRVLNLSLEKI